MKLKKILLLFLLITLTQCSSRKDDLKNELVDEVVLVEEVDVTQPKVIKDLDVVLKEGKLKVSTTYSGTSYFLYKGQPMGFEYELLERFAEHLGVDIEIIVANDINNLISNLNTGKVDLIAHGLTITRERQRMVNFSDYIYLTHQVLVQKKPDNWRKMKLHEIDR